MSTLPSECATMLMPPCNVARGASLDTLELLQLQMLVSFPTAGTSGWTAQGWTRHWQAQMLQLGMVQGGK